jgi:hypothetical protein
MLKYITENGALAAHLDIFRVLFIVNDMTELGVFGNLEVLRIPE